MSARVNLLPRELEQRSRARRSLRMSVFVVLVALAIMGGLYAYQAGEVRQAEEERDRAADEVARLEAELASLEEFRVLLDRHTARSELLASAMEREISWARVLNDLALAFPGDASLLTLAADAEDPDEPAPGEIATGDRVGQITASGYSVEEYAPGVQTVLIDFEGARGFFNTYLQTAGVTEIGGTEVTNFNGTIDLDDDVYTERYADGLPPEAQR